VTIDITVTNTNNVQVKRIFRWLYLWIPTKGEANRKGRDGRREERGSSSTTRKSCIRHCWHTSVHYDGINVTMSYFSYFAFSFISMEQMFMLTRSRIIDRRARRNGVSYRSIYISYTDLRTLHVFRTTSAILDSPFKSKTRHCSASKMYIKHFKVSNFQVPTYVASPRFPRCSYRRTVGATEPAWTVKPSRLRRRTELSLLSRVWVECLATVSWFIWFAVGRSTWDAIGNGR